MAIQSAGDLYPSPVQYVGVTVRLLVFTAVQSEGGRISSSLRSALGIYGQFNVWLVQLKIPYPSVVSERVGLTAGGVTVAHDSTACTELNLGRRNVALAVRELYQFLF